MRRLLPPPGPDDEVGADRTSLLHEAYAWPRACVRGLMVGSVDGAAELDGSSKGLSGPPDRAVLAHLRGTCDVVLVGGATVRADGWLPPRPSQERRRWRREQGMAEVPAYAVVSRSGDLPAGDSDGEVLVLSGDPHQVLEELAGRGLRRVLCEGGPSWLAALAGAGLLEELCLTTSPQLAGPGRTGLLEGAGWQFPLALRLIGLLEDDGWLFARWAVAGGAGGPPPKVRRMAETVPGADPQVVGPYLAQALGDDRWSTPEVRLIAGGKSNLTYRVDSAAGSVVLRRPPLGHVLPTAHDMVREHTVLTALGPTEVPVPRTLHLCTDTEVLGQPFYVMEHVDGHVCQEDLPAGYADRPEQRRAVGEGLVAVLATLHEVDPEAVGLGEFGRPEGYLERQVRRWLKQWDATRLEGYEHLDTLGADLAAALPTTQRHAVVHGDYRLDNTILDPAEPGRVAAVLDWEMSTLGDPLADLGILLGYWSQAGDSGPRTQALVVPAATVLEGFPTRAEVAELYAARTGLDLGPLPWYVSFAAFKLAVVCAGIVARVRGGAMVGSGFDGIEQRIGPLVEIGRAALSDRSL